MNGVTPNRDRVSAQINQDVLGGNPRKEHAEEFSKSDGYRSHGARLDDQEQCPAIKETKKRAERLAQVYVLAARVGHHCRQLAVSDRGHDGHQATQDPGLMLVAWGLSGLLT